MAKLSKKIRKNIECEYMRTKRQASTGPSITLNGILIAEITWRGLGDRKKVQRLILVRNEKNGLEVKNAVDLGAERNRSVQSIDACK